MQLGILSRRAVERRKIEFASVAAEEIQERRKPKNVPGGRPLHEYVNLYISARNPMMYRRRSKHAELCVLQVSPQVLNLPNVVIADGNAASQYTAFWPSPSGLAKIDKDTVFAEHWTDPDPISKLRKTRVKCAEVLVPDRVDPSLIVGVYVSSAEVEAVVKQGGLKLPIQLTHTSFLGDKEG
jgi:hypothetical protein